MSDVADAVTQDQLADSLMGTADEGQSQADNAGAVAEPQVEETQTENLSEGQQEEEISDWLPTEQQKIFPDEVLEQYAEKRYPEVLAMLRANPNNPQLRQLLQDKLNTDIHLRDQSLRQEQEELYQPEAEERPEPTQAQPQLTVEQHLQQVARIADSITQPEIANAFAGQFLKAFGVNEAPTPEVAQNLTRTMTVFGLNLLNTVLPQMLTAPQGEGKNFFQQLVEQSYEGFGESYETSMYERAWQKAQASDPKFASLPGFRDKGSDELRVKAAEKYAGSVEEFEAMQFKDSKTGKVLSPYQNNVKKYTILARLMHGEKVSPAEAAKFIEAGKKAERRGQTTRSAGAVSSGKSNQQIQSQGGQFQSNSDLFDAEAIDSYRRQHGRI